MEQECSKKSTADFIKVELDDIRDSLIKEVENLWGSDTELTIFTDSDFYKKFTIRQVLREYKLKWQENKNSFKVMIW